MCICQAKGAFSPPFCHQSLHSFTTKELVHFLCFVIVKKNLVKREIIGDKVHDVLTATMTERLKNMIMHY